MGLPFLFILVLTHLFLPVRAPCGVDSFFLSGLSFFGSGDIDQTARDLGTRGLNPAYDGDFLVTIGDVNRAVALLGFGFFWSRRTESLGDLPFVQSKERARLQILGFPFSVGYAKRIGPPSKRGWVWGAMGHFYFLKASVENPEPEDPAWFRIRSDQTGERDAQGPGASVFVAYEVPFFLGKIGLGVKGRWTSISVEEIRGLGTPDLDLNGATLFLSVALTDG